MNETIEEKRKTEETIAKIREKFPEIPFPEPVLEPIYYGRLSKNIIDNRKLVMDKNTGEQFDIVSDMYSLVHHEVVLDKLMSAIPEHFGEPEFQVNFFGAGARSVFTASFPHMKYDVNGSPGYTRFILKNSYDRSSFLSLSYGLMELVCTNGLVAFREKERARAKHLDKSITDFSLQEKIEQGIGIIEESVESWRKWETIKLPETVIQEALEYLPFSETEQEKLFSLPLLNHNGESLASLGSKSSLWTLNSSATQYAHEVAAERKLTIEEKLPNVMQKLAMKYAA